jgi:hypothetical protein
MVFRAAIHFRNPRHNTYMGCSIDESFLGKLYKRDVNKVLREA